MASEKPTAKGQAWFCTTGLPSDVVIEVEEMTFHLHKFPLISKSLKLHELITEQEKNPKSNPTKLQKSSDQEEDKDSIIAERVEEEEEDEEEGYCHILLPDFPGGSEAFETAAKFCYGVKIDLSPSNVAPLRCAGDFLQMTDEYSEDNLISKTERYISQNVLRNIKDSIQTLHSCQNHLPLAENIGIVEKCINAVVSKASSTDPSLFGWPVEKTSSSRRTPASGAAGAPNLWFEELTILNLEFFRRLVSAMKEENLSPEIIESCLIFYAKKYIPGILRANRKSSSSCSSFPTENEQRNLLETVISYLPMEKSSSASTTTKFLFGLLRTAYILNASEISRAMLEKKIGSQLEQATLDDLLIPSYSYLNETLYDVDCVERLLRYFQEGLEVAAGVEGEAESGGERSAALMLVGKLIDGYLSEIASDANLKPDRFYQLAVSLPDYARLFEDGLYRAIDVYLKAHPWISESEREKICSMLDYQKLTLEACTHAAQNERLPLRAVVQVLFFEQLKLRQAIAGTLLGGDMTPSETERESGGLSAQQEEEEEAVEVGGGARGGTRRLAVRENQVLRLNMDSMRTRVKELEKECTTMRKAMEKIDRKVPAAEETTGGWRSKFGCKFKTQVCDSQEAATVVDTRKGRRHRRR